LPQGQPLSHPLTELTRVARSRLGEADLFQPASSLLAGLPPPEPLQARQLDEVALGAPARLEVRGLDHRTCSSPKDPVPPPNIEAVDDEARAGPRAETEEAPHGAGLARPVVPQEAGDGARQDIQVQPVHGHPTAGPNLTWSPRTLIAMGGA
jgi:hypothetical protein